MLGMQGDVRRRRETGRERHPEGVVVRHSRRCAMRTRGACSCTPSYQAQVWSARDQRTIRKTFSTIAAARAWRQESQVALRSGSLRAPAPITLDQAAQKWLAAAEAGIIRTRSGDPYKPSSLRSYQEALRLKVLPALGQQRLAAITTPMLQDFADELAATSLSPSSIRNALMPLRAIYRRAKIHGDVAVNPTLELSLPTSRTRRERIAPPQEAAALIAAVPPPDRAIWAIALYAGLRRGEIQALDWSLVDLDNNLIRIERSWDRVAGFIAPKSRSARRRVPIANTLRTHLLDHRLKQGSSGCGLVYPNNHDDRPFSPSTIMYRARTAWAKAELEPITLHECRHTYAAYMIAAGVNAKALSTYMGHASITMTLDRYGHLLPGNERDAAILLDRWLREQH